MTDWKNGELDNLTVTQVRQICEEHGLRAVCNDGKLLRFEKEEADNAETGNRLRQ